MKYYAVADRLGKWLIIQSLSKIYKSAGNTIISPRRANAIMRATKTPNKIVGINDANSIALKPKIKIKDVKITALPEDLMAKSIL